MPIDENASLLQALTLEPLLEAALREAPAREFRDTSFIPALERVLEIPTRGDFSEAGLRIVHSNFLRFLVNRLRYEAAVERNPEILEEDVSDPMVVLGLPRSGTTMLQRLLSSDPAVQATHAWRMYNPAPFPGEAADDPMPRIRWAEEMLGVVTGTNEDYKLVHEFKAMEPDETSFVPLANFDYVMQAIPTPDAIYLDWARSVSRVPPLTYLKKMLQYLQWQDGGRRDRPWLIKNPGHTGEIAEMLEVFPNATFVISMRDLSVTMASSMKMMCEILPQSYRAIDPQRVADETVEYWCYELHRYLDQRRELGTRIRVVETSYGNLMADPLGVARELHDLHGLPWTRQAEQAMNQWRQDNPRHKHGKNEYALEDYGWNSERIESTFGQVAIDWRGY